MSTGLQFNVNLIDKSISPKYAYEPLFLRFEDTHVTFVVACGHHMIIIQVVRLFYEAEAFKQIKLLFNLLNNSWILVFSMWQVWCAHARSHTCQSQLFSVMSAWNFGRHYHSSNHPILRKFLWNTFAKHQIYFPSDQTAWYNSIDRIYLESLFFPL